MKYQPIITVGRQYGSGGRYVARLLAEKLGIPFYDKELLAEASRDSGICQELLESYDEKQGKNLLFSLISGAQPRGEAGTMYMDMPLNHKIFLAQFDTIRRIADEGPCVIVGRCADYVLRGRPELLRVFIQAPMNRRIRTIMDRKHLSEDQAKKLIREVDKDRASYYRYYTDQVWGEAGNYDLVIDSSRVGTAGAVKVIVAFLDAMKK